MKNLDIINGIVNTIDGLDNYFTKFNGKIAEKWCDKTGRSKKDLEKTLYTAGAVGMGVEVANNFNPLALFCAGVSATTSLVEKFRPSPKKNTIENSNFYDIQRLLDITMYISCPPFIISDIVNVVQDIATSDYSSCINDITILSFDLGLFGYFSGNYVSRSAESPREKKSIVSHSR